MGLTLTATQTSGKHLLGNPANWIILVEFQVTGIKSLAWAGAGGWVVGDWIVGSTSKARGRIIENSSSPMYLYDVTGSFSAGETITGYTAGTGTASGVQGDDDRTLRYAREQEDVTWDSETWTATALDFEFLGKSIDGSWTDVTLHIFNDETINDYAEKCQGLKNETVIVRLVYGADLTEAAASTETFTIKNQSYPSIEWLDFSLGMEKPLSQAFPNMRYETTPCRHKFKGTTSCQYAGAATACGKNLATCLGLSNTTHYGAFPGIPGALIA